MSFIWDEDAAGKKRKEVSEESDGSESFGKIEV